MKGFKLKRCVGGTKIKTDIEELKENPTFVIGTPGRVLNMIDRECLKLNDLKLFILDELDETYSRGFKEIILKYFKYIPKHTQFCVLSATYNTELMKFCYGFMKDPFKILLKKERNKYILFEYFEIYFPIVL